MDKDLRFRTKNDDRLLAEPDFDKIYPIGSVYISVINKCPSELFGGIWERICEGKTLIGVDENDTDFNSPEKVGGEGLFPQNLLLQLM